ncbi:hypothetical protein [Mesorhizobium sp. ES1-4]|uniref:hypothetical protein n=1 Tax=Mesorhizobium sp. ES1-4 TaxID=2876627 RepID=UPI001CCF7A25|nr:hypothetical protein [Mesorhizobium sp. ES1-4]MBZ9798337.1 hypothetical protein [Mesorhizobium sp. ES1-4]
MLLILGYKGDPSQIVPLQRTPSRLRKGELYRLILKHEADGSASNREPATRIVLARGWDAALIKPLMNNISEPYWSVLPNTPASLVSKRR